MESKSQSVDIDTLKKDFHMLMEHLRIISCTGEYIFNNKKKHNMVIPRKYLPSSDKFKLNKYVAQEIFNDIFKIYIQNLGEEWNFFAQPYKIKMAIINTSIDTIYDAIIQFIDKIVKTLQDQLLSKEILEYAMRFLSSRQKYSNMKKNECILFKTKLSLLEQHIKIKYQGYIDIINRAIVEDPRSLLTELSRVPPLVSAPMISAPPLVSAPVVSLPPSRKVDDGFVLVETPSTSPQQSRTAPGSSLLSRLRRTFRRRRGGKRKKKKTMRKKGGYIYKSKSFKKKKQKRKKGKKKNTKKKRKR